MKKVFITILMALPLVAYAQSELTPQQKLEQAQKQLEEAKKAVADAEKAAGKKNDSTQGWVVPENQKKTTSKKTTKSKDADEKSNPKYLQGAVNTNAEGRVEFEMKTDANGKSAKQIYNLVYNYLSELTQNEENIASRIALVNPTEHTIACSMDEWLVFSKSFLSLDRSQFKYQLVAEIADNSLKLTMNRIYYLYEQDRSTGFTQTAEKTITDDIALTKKKNSLARVFGKFRKGTIDRKDEIFGEIAELVKK